MVSPAMSALLTTDSLEYNIESAVGITGYNFTADEIVHLEITYLDGTALPVTIQSTWDVVADRYGSTRDDLDGFLTGWMMDNEINPGDSLLLIGTGETSGFVATAPFYCKKYTAHQLQNSTGGWAYGNINSSNSCYSEGSNVPYRFFAYNLWAGSTHSFRIDFRATKSGYHGLDYLSEYDLTEVGPIAAFGGECGNTSKPAPADCFTPIAVAVLPDPTSSASYASTVPPELSGILSPLFAIDGPGDLYAYNATNVSFSQISIGGTVSDRILSVTVTFDVIAYGSVGFYWGGHLAEGQSDTWGLGQGAAAIAGAPYHMSAGKLDGKGGMSNLSIKGLEVCYPPDVTLTCDSDPYCVGTTHTCSVPSGADTYFWTVTGATIISGQNTSSISYTITAAAGDPITISISACDVITGCGGTGCCSEATTEFIADGCCTVDITCPTDVTVACDESTDPASTGTATYTVIGSCPTLITVSYTDTEVVGTCVYEKTITRLWKAFDGNSVLRDQCTQTITVVDNTSPVLAGCPADVSVECDAIPAAASVTATDNCDPAPTVDFTETSASGACAQEYVLTRTWTATDACGNIATCIQYVTVEDTQAPSVTCPAPVTVQCLADVPAVDLNQVTAIDNCDPSPVVAFVSDMSDGQTCPETITRTYQATDDCGNMATCTQTITVDDTTPPVMTCPADISLQCDDPTDPSFTGTATATDNCSTVGNITVAFSDQINGGIVRTWTATDECGNQASCVQTITIVGDDEPPQFTCPPDFAVECLEDIPSPAPGAITATDNCDPNPIVTFLGEAQSGTTCPITITRTFRATDASGNFVECTQTITIDDLTPPVLVGCPDDIVINCEDPVPPPADVTATDNCDGVTIDFVQTETAGDPYSCSWEITITRTWTATDVCGNQASCVQTITVEDNEAPIITCPDPITVECAADVPAPNTSLVTATDNCDPTPDIIFFSDVSDGQTCPETITRKYRARDDCGNFSLCSQTITINDITPPVVTCPADVEVDCMADIPQPDIGLVTATDNCDPTPVITFISDVPNGTGCPMTITRTYRATDACDNFAECSQIISVDDQIPPQITCPTDLTVEWCHRL